MAAPTYKGKGTASAGFTVNTAIALPTAGAAPAAGDLIFVIAESGNATLPTITDTNYIVIKQWDSFADGGVGSTTSRTVLSLWCKVATASESNPTMTPGNNHTSAQTFTVSGHGVTDPATDIVVGAGTAGTSGSGGISMPGITVTADSLILMCASTSLDGLTGDFNSFTAWANSNLASVTERTDQVVATGNGGGYGLATGTCAGTTTGASTATLPAVDYSAFQVGVPPVAGGTNVSITTAGSVAVTGQATTTIDEVALTAGSVAVTGAAQALTNNVAITPGAVAVTGSTGLTTSIATVVNITPGVVSVDGQQSTLKTDIALTNGAVAVTGSTVTTDVATVVDITVPGAVAVTGSTVALSTDVALTAGAVAVTGQTVTPTVGTLVTIDTAGSVTTTGSDVALSTNMTLTPGQVGVGNGSVSLANALELLPGTVTVDGRSAGLTVALVTSNGTVSVVGQTVTTTSPAGVTIDTPGQVVVAGRDVTVFPPPAGVNILIEPKRLSVQVKGSRVRASASAPAGIFPPVPFV